MVVDGSKLSGVGVFSNSTLSFTCGNSFNFGIELNVRGKLLNAFIGVLGFHSELFKVREDIWWGMLINISTPSFRA